MMTFISPCPTILTYARTLQEPRNQHFQPQPPGSPILMHPVQQPMQPIPNPVQPPVQQQMQVRPPMQPVKLQPPRYQSPLVKQPVAPKASVKLTSRPVATPITEPPKVEDPDDEFEIPQVKNLKAFISTWRRPSRQV